MAQDNHSKEYLVSIMFSHYDQNNNGNLERDELDQVAEREDLEQLSKGCSLGHMISFDDVDRDGRLNINEFYLAFSKLYSKLHGNLVFLPILRFKLPIIAYLRGLVTSPCTCSIPNRGISSHCLTKRDCVFQPSGLYVRSSFPSKIDRHLGAPRP
jgi:hypothetical protein